MTASRADRVGTELARLAADDSLTEEERFERRVAAEAIAWDLHEYGLTSSELLKMAEQECEPWITAREMMRHAAFLMAIEEEMDRRQNPPGGSGDAAPVT